MTSEETPLSLQAPTSSNQSLKRINSGNGLTITMAIFFIVGEMAGSGILALPL